jgi:hypothetical protein
MPALSRILAIKPIEVFYIDNTSYPLGIIIPVLYAQKSTINVFKVPRILTLSN